MSYWSARIIFGIDWSKESYHVDVEKFHAEAVVVLVHYPYSFFV